MILLPFLALLAWTHAFRRAGRGWLEAATASFIVFGVTVALATELQSVLGALTAVGSTVAWVIATLVALVVAQRAPAPAAADADPAPLRAGELAPVVLLLVLTGIVAWLAAPNSYDGLTYHLVRVERWIQQGSVRPFATWNTRQLFMPPWSEYAMLQFRLLSGGDRLANLVEWGCFAAACGGASLLARALGGSRSAAVLAAGLVATLPMAVAQASGTQTDVVAACWAVLAAAFGYRLLTAVPRRPDTVLAALALALAAESKQTSLLFGAVALLPVLGLLLARRRFRTAVELAGVALAAVLVIAGPQVQRNRAVFGSALGDPVWRDDVAMTTRQPNQVAGNVLRNLAVHFGTPIDGVNDAVMRGVAGVSRAIGANPDDPRTTWNSHFIATPWNTHEESAPNPLHLLLIIGCLAGWGLAKATAAQRWFVVSLLAGLVIFCAELKWQSYNSRLHTPLFVLALAWAAVRLERWPLAARRGLLLLLTLAALPGALCNYTRPLVTLPGGAITPRPGLLATSRTDGYFTYEPLLAEPYLDVAHKIAASGCNDVGMHTWPDAWEYPVMAVVRDAGSAARFRAVGVTNASARFMTDRAPPCLLLQIWTEAGTPPPWAADWRMLAQWDVAPGRPGIALFAPPR